MEEKYCFYIQKAGFSLKRGTAAPHRGVKPANKVGAVNYVKMYRVYDRTTVRFSHVFTIITNVVRPYYDNKNKYNTKYKRQNNAIEIQKSIILS